MSDKLIMRKHRKVSANKIIRFFTVRYKFTSQAVLKNPLRNACEKIVFNRFQVYSLQI